MKKCTKLTLSLVTILTLGTALHAENLIKNGSFEDYTISQNNGSWKLVEFNNWTGAGEAWNSKIGKKATDGEHKIELDVGRELNELSQIVTTVEGKKYKLSLDAYARIWNSSDFQILVDGEVVATINPNGEWAEYSAYFIGKGAEQVISLKELDEQNSGLGTIIDNMKLEESEEMIVNGSFEAFTINSNHGNWKLVTFDGWEGVGEVWNAYLGKKSTKGSYKIELDAGYELNALSQTVTTQSNREYLLSLDAYARVKDSSDFEIWIDDEKLKDVKPSDNWQRYNFKFFGNGEAQKIQIHEIESQNNTLGAIIDNVSLIPTENYKDESKMEVRPLLWLGSKEDGEAQGIRWGQGKPYNNLTPKVTNSSGELVSTRTGCVATAMGMIMRYWKHPEVGVGENHYLPKTHGAEIGELSIDFSNEVYNWADMPLHLSSDSNDAIGKALYDIGLSVNMDYMPGGSSASKALEGFRDYFDYGFTINLTKNIYSKEAWEKILKEQLDRGRPLYYTGSHGFDQSHAWVIDGYNEEGKFHINWGWNGGGGYYSLDKNKLGYYSSNQGLTIVAPRDDSEQIVLKDEKLAQCLSHNAMEQFSFEGGVENLREDTIRYLKNINCNNQDITTTDDLSFTPYITNIKMNNNHIQGTIDLSKQSELKSIELGNNSIKSINVTGLDRLQILNLRDNNIGGHLDLSDKESMRFINLSNNDDIKKLSLPKEGVFSLNINGTALNIEDITNLKNIVYFNAKNLKISCKEEKMLKEKYAVGTKIFNASCVEDDLEK